MMQVRRLKRRENTNDETLARQFRTMGMAGPTRSKTVSRLLNDMMMGDTSKKKGEPQLQHASVAGS